jgi:hypothetical protein
MRRTIDTTTADDGTELQLKERSDGDYVVTEAGSDARTGEVVQSREAGRQKLQETSRLYGFAEQSTASSGFGGGVGGGFGGGAGGALGGGLSGGMGMTDRDSDRDTGGNVFGGNMGGSLFGGGMTNDGDSGESDSGGSLFGGFGGGGSSGGAKRDPDTGKFAPSRPRDTNFEMARDENGQFSGRKDDSDEDGGGLFGFLR